MVGGESFPVDELAGICEDVVETIEYSWKKTGVERSFLSLLRRALPLNQHEVRDLSKTQDRWILLPGLCCQAAGGEIKNTTIVTAAWYLFYIAGHIMDSIQDSDEPDIWWKELGAGLALNVASGLFFTANDILTQLYNTDITNTVAQKINNDFNAYLFSMCAGQHIDMYYNDKTLIQFWEANDLKSGSFFALACRAGARIAQDADDQIDRFGTFGHHLGVIIQILDELEDWYKLSTSQTIKTIRQLNNTLPFIYLMDVLPDSKRIPLKELVEQTPLSQPTIKQLMDDIEESGASFYILTMIEKHKDLARKALRETNSLAPASFFLGNLLEGLGEK